MSVTPPLIYCQHGYSETEHCRVCEILRVCKACGKRGEPSRLEKVVALANRSATDGEREAASLAAERLAALEGKEVVPTSEGIGVFEPERADLLRALDRIASR